MLHLLRLYNDLITKAQGPKKARFFFWRSLLLWPNSFQFLNFIDKLYRDHGFDQASLDVVRTKFTRTYYSRKWSKAQQLAAIKAHYSLIEARFDRQTRQDMLSHTPIALAEVVAKSGDIYAFSVAQHERYRAEGELSLFMHKSGDPIPLATLTFSVDEQNLRIGGLQGPQAEDAKQRVVDATKDLHGWRPKGAVFDVLYGVVRALRIRHIEALATANHPLRQAKRAFVADNDAFWQEMTLGQTPMGDFILPIVANERSVEEVAAKKRKDWLKRQAYKTEASDQAQMSLIKRMI